MHKLMNFICDELRDIEDKTDKGKLTLNDIQYADTLAHLKKTLLIIDGMESGEDYSRDEGSYRRGRDSMGRYASRDGGSYRGSYYSRDGKEDLEEKLREMEHSAKDEESRRMVREWLNQMR